MIRPKKACVCSEKETRNFTSNLCRIYMTPRGHTASSLGPHPSQVLATQMNSSGLQGQQNLNAQLRHRIQRKLKEKEVKQEAKRRRKKQEGGRKEEQGQERNKEEIHKNKKTERNNRSKNNKKKFSNYNCMLQSEKDACYAREVHRFHPQ